ncbi:unnamed protein product [Victoria cruziana]
MAVKEKEKDWEGTRGSSNGDIMKEEKNVMVEGESKETVEYVERKDKTNEAVENVQNRKEDSDKEDTEEEDMEKVETKKQKRGASKTKKKKEKAKKIKDAKKGTNSKGGGKTKEPGTPAAATVERPTRERKSVDRFVISNEKDLPKEFSIEKGRGTQLKDIPNVAYKLSKRRADDVLKMLHTILYGRRVKNFQIKSNISQFSGFVWADNEEKQKMKMKEKLDKCFKSRLLEFCELLDMPAKFNDRKEDLVDKLLEFMEAPHATTDVLLSEKEKSGKGKKQKRVVRSSSKSPSSSGRRLKKEVEKDDHSDEGEEVEDEEEQEEVEDEQEGEQEGDATEESGESDQEDPEEKSEEEDVKKSKSANKGSKKFPKKAATSKARKSKNAIKTEEKPSSKARVLSSKKCDSEKEDKSSTPQKRKRDDKGDHKLTAEKKAKKSEHEKDEKPSTLRSPPSNGKAGKNSAAKVGADKKDKAGPTEEELRKAICDLLKEVDFNTATFTDILKQLAANFETDLMPRKAEVKSMIQDELTKLTDDADDEDEDEDEEGDGDKEDDN